MQRETEFRGKERKTGKWVFGNLVISQGGTLEGRHYHIFPIEEEGMHWVDPETVGEYTGLKDKKSIKIFEGDIVKDPLDDIGVIVFSDDFCGWKIEYHNFGGGSWRTPRNDIEVIGNIHDNPELLHAN